MTLRTKEKKIRLSDNKMIFIIGILYTLTALIIVASAWIENIYRYDLSLTISIYIALRPWTAVFYGFVSVIMTALGVKYIKNCAADKSQKIMYYIVFACILGCGLCPCNGSWSRIMTLLHNDFAIGLMLLAATVFVFSLIKAKNSVQRVVSVISVVYALLFIVLYLFLNFRFFYMTLFIWENIFIYLLLANMYFEKTVNNT